MIVVGVVSTVIVGMFIAVLCNGVIFVNVVGGGAGVIICMV